MQTKWKIVPVEPTEDMLNTIANQPYGADYAYEDMLSAAPPCEDLETVRAALLTFIDKKNDGRPHKNFYGRPLIDEALAALGRIRGEG